MGFSGTNLTAVRFLWLLCYTVNVEDILRCSGSGGGGGGGGGGSKGSVVAVNTVPPQNVRGDNIHR